MVVAAAEGVYAAVARTGVAPEAAPAARAGAGPAVVAWEGVVWEGVVWAVVAPVVRADGQDVQRDAPAP